MPNGSSAEAIFEKIDSLICSALRPWIPGNTSTIDLNLSAGTLPFVLTGVVNISAVAGNTLSVNSDGLYVPTYVNPFQVKVDTTAPPRYLANAVVGGTDGCVSITTPDISGMLNIQPSLNLQCLANLICDTPAILNQLGVCILSSALAGAITPEDSTSIHLTATPIGSGVQLQATSKISATAGNVLTINSDGLYVPTPTGGIATANNGLTATGSNIQLGGTLVKTTNIDFGPGFQLNFIDSPLISIGASTPLTNATLSVVDTNSASVAGTTMSLNQVRMLNNTAQYIANNSQLEITGPAFTQTGDSYNNALGGQLWWNPTGDQTLTASPMTSYAGIYGVVIKSSNFNLLDNTTSGGFFAMFAADSGNISDAAGVRIGGVGNAPSIFGSPFTGTINNYYGLRIEDITASPHGANITNKYAIYQAGTSDKSLFFGPVQNAGGTTQFTSDARVKENIKDFTRGLTEIDQIKTHLFNYTYNKSKVVTGIIAQELEAIIPEAVDKGNFSTPDGTDFTDFRMVDQNVLFYTMINAIKELSAQNKQLNDRLFALEAKK
jgi:hypothetical protein